VGLLGAGLLLGDGGDAGRSGDGTADRGGSNRVLPRPVSPTTRPSTTTTTEPPPVPVLPGAGVRLLLLGEDGAELVDLDTGITADAPVPRAAYGVVAAGEGVVYLDRAQAWYVALPPDGRAAEAVALGRAEEVFAGDEPEHVWLFGPVPGTPGDRYQVTLVDLTGAVLAGPREVTDGYVAGGHPEGIVLQVAGRVYLVGRGGEVRALATGDVVGVADGWLLTRSCDDQLQCGLTVWTPELRARPVATGGGSAYGGSLAVDASGRRAALLLYGRGQVNLEVLDLGTGTAEVVELSGGGDVMAATWLPADLGLLVARSSEVVRVHERDGQRQVDRLLDRGGDQMFILQG
jgi:hypothetical protein